MDFMYTSVFFYFFYFVFVYLNHYILYVFLTIEFVMGILDIVVFY